MLKNLIKSACLLLVLAAARQAGAFTLWGPLETWQTADLDYGARYYYANVPYDTRLGYVENGGPKSFGEGSRLTTPIVTYGFDDTFLEYFGAKGVEAIDSAMKLLNGLPAASSANLTNFLTDDNQQINYTAQADELVDLKSAVMWLMIEHMGLLGETHVWDLSLRGKYGPAVCDYDYYVVNRSYDPVTYDPTPYVNGRQFAYSIWDGCTIGVDVGDAIEVPMDTASPRYTAVATPQGLEWGGYYLGITRDDMAGLKFLYKKNYYLWQAVDSNAVVLPFTSSWVAVNTTNTITGISNFNGEIGGVEKITFVKVNYDSLLGTQFTPITYHYKIPFVTNSRLSQLEVTRTITAPDVIFTAANLVVPAAANQFPVPLFRSGSFVLNNYVSVGFGQGGTPAPGVVPETINASMIVTFNNVGPIYFNVNPYFTDELNISEYPVFNWGSFDGTTNPPIVFPVGSSLSDLEAEVLLPLAVGPPPDTFTPVLNPNTNNVNSGTGGTGGGGQ